MAHPVVARGMVNTPNELSPLYPQRSAAKGGLLACVSLKPMNGEDW
jgi:hypothetical protein